MHDNFISQPEFEYNCTAAEIEQFNSQGNYQL